MSSDGLMMFPSCTDGLGPFKPRWELHPSRQKCVCVCVCLTLNPKPSHIIYMSMYINLYGYIYIYTYICVYNIYIYTWTGEKKRYSPWHHQIVPAKIHQNPPLLSPQLAGAIGEARHHDGLVFFQRRRLDPEAPAAAKVVVVGPEGPMADDGCCRSWSVEQRMTQAPWNQHFYNVRPPSYKLVNKSPSNHSYTYHKP